MNVRSIVNIECLLFSYARSSVCARFHGKFIVFSRLADEGEENIVRVFLSFFLERVEEFENSRK